MDQKTERLDRYLSNRGFTSRRNIKKFLKEHVVEIDGKRVRESGHRFNPETQKIHVDGNKPTQSKLVYFLLNKPTGIISTSSDEFGRKNVVSLINSQVRVYPVGRLDKDTSGLILLTNDGELTHKLTHPKFHVPKVYRLTIKGKLTKQQKQMFENGVILSDGITNNASLTTIDQLQTTSILEAVLHEGRYRQIRRMCEALEIALLSLERIQFGPIKIGALKSGESRELSTGEILSLRSAVEK